MTQLAVIVGYLALLLALGAVSARFFRGTSQDYFVASRSIGPFLLLMSLFGTTMTAFALVGSTGKAYTTGVGVYGMMASWSGRGRYVTLHVQAGSGDGIPIESWYVWDDAAGRPVIEVTLPALESFVMERLAEASDDELLADLADDVAAWDGWDEIVSVSAN